MRDPFAPIRVVSISDPAVLFLSDEARAQYRSTRDPALIKPRDLAAPCVFVVQPCSAETAIRLDAAAADIRALLAFRACVHRVELPSGEVLEATTYESVAYGSIANEEWIKAVAPRVGPRRIIEIGEAAYRLSMLDDSDPLSLPPGQAHPS